MSGLLVASILHMGARRSVGGSAWNYYTVSDDSVTEETTLTLEGTRMLYVVRDKPDAYGQSQAGAPVGVDQWVLKAPIETDIASGGYVQSQADPAIVFVLGTLETDQGYITGIVERTTLPDLS